MTQQKIDDRNDRQYFLGYVSEQINSSCHKDSLTFKFNILDEYGTTFTNNRIQEIANILCNDSIDKTIVYESNIMRDSTIEIKTVCHNKRLIQNSFRKGRLLLISVHVLRDSVLKSKDIIQFEPSKHQKLVRIRYPKMVEN